MTPKEQLAQRIWDFAVDMDKHANYYASPHLHVLIRDESDYCRWLVQELGYAFYLLTIRAKVSEVGEQLAFAQRVLDGMYRKRGSRVCEWVVLAIEKKFADVLPRED